jgi:hypothetical protein
MRAAAIVSGLAMFCAVAAAALGIFAQGIEGQRGFLGPGALIADVNLALNVVLVLGLTFGAWLARRGRIEAHRINQTIWVLVNAALVTFIMLSSMQDVKVDSLAALGDTRVWLTWLHATIGTLTLIAGLWLVLQMNDLIPSALHVRAWKTLMRWTLAGYWAVALLGMWMYPLWYPAPAP